MLCSEIWENSFKGKIAGRRLMFVLNLSAHVYKLRPALMSSTEVVLKQYWAGIVLFGSAVPIYPAVRGICVFTMSLLLFVSIQLFTAPSHIILYLVLYLLA